jgi:hypothetical protein
MLMEKIAPLEQQKLDGLTPEERFANHKAGTKAAWVVMRYGLRLLPQLDARKGRSNIAPRFHSYSIDRSES